MANLERTSSGTVVRYLETGDAYDLWAPVYDTDGNFLQVLDSIELKTLIPKLFSLLESPRPWKIVDLGCGTGRNTVQLASIPDTDITALDLSPNMLEIARKRPDVLPQDSAGESNRHPVTFRVFDMLDPSSAADAPRGADAVVSTLVVEHVSLPEFFSATAAMLKNGGLLLLTNMHSEMGNISQAGFVDPQTGDKIRPKSYAHNIDEIITEAASCGFQVAVDFEERSVKEEDCEVLGPRSTK
jgi:predicted TPR repeat methyltransferase